MEKPELPCTQGNTSQSTAVILPALLIAPAARSWLRSTSGATILNVFEDACNLVNRDNEVLSLVSPTIGPGPFSIVVGSGYSESPPRINFLCWISVESPVHPTERMLGVGPVCIEVTGSALWQSRPNWKSVSPAILSKYLPVAINKLQKEAPADTLAPLVIGGKQSVMHLSAMHGWLVLKEGLAAEDQDLCAKGATILAGLGSGLTPSGDDFLIGVIYGLWATRRRQVAAKLSGVIASSAISRTSRLSAAWLRAAKRAEAGLPWHQFIEAMSTDERRSVRNTLNLIMGIGHTSGADALTGFVAAIQILNNGG